jgi:hypothetical protein
MHVAAMGSYAVPPPDTAEPLVTLERFLALAQLLEVAASELSSLKPGRVREARSAGVAQLPCHPGFAWLRALHLL